MYEITKSQVEYAKSVDLLEYLQRHEPDNLKKVGRSYQLKDHDSFSISNGKWNWFSQGVGCCKSTALNYLTKVRGYDFKEAVRLLAEDRGIAYEPSPRSPPERRPLLLPTRNSNTRRVSAYLQTRGIDKATIDECVKAGFLYESAFYHNCVFVGRSSTNRIKYAAMRGTNTDFKQDAFGSDKRYGFKIPPKSERAESVSVFESPIDAMSYRTLINNGLQVADTYLLSLGGVSDIALRQFLSCHKNIKEIVVCTDNDVAGNEAFERISKTFDIPVKRDKPQFGKDWNDSLLAIRELWYEHNVQVKSMATGLQSVKSLTKQGNSLANIEITGDNIGVFKRTARKYNIDFSLKKDNSENPPKWIVFFKSKDADATTAAFKDFSNVILKQKQKPSVLTKLNKLKEFVKTVAAPVKKHHRGEQSR